MYAIIETGGKQYKVSEGDVIDVEKLEGDAGAEITFDKILAVSDGTLRVADEAKGATVKGSIVEQGRGKKIIVYRFKAKSGYHKKKGHRQAYTRVKIDSIAL
ncbi:MAG: 50S ribosomal protein L21 [Lachnospiraceae bacterium]|nr:50S ribosomal protein L21 [Lachnospiraceae bacterium]